VILEDTVYAGPGDSPNRQKEPEPKRKSSAKLLVTMSLVNGILCMALIGSVIVNISLTDQAVRANHRFDESIAIGKRLMAGMDEQHKTIEIQNDTIEIQQRTIAMLREKS
jgi:hypothetical protein